MTSPITRITLLKIPSTEHQALALEGYKDFIKNQNKNGIPYIISMEGGPLSVQDDARSQGYTFVAKAVFKDQSDIVYYEVECESHKTFKAFLKENGVEIQGLMAVVYTPSASS